MVDSVDTGLTLPAGTGGGSASVAGTVGDPEEIRENVLEGPAGSVLAADNRRFYRAILRELLVAPRTLARLVSSAIFHAAGHAATAVAAGLLGRALVRSSVAGSPGPWGWGLEALCYVGLVATLVKATSSISLAFSETQAGGRIGCSLRRRVVRELVQRGSHDSAPRVLATIAVRVREVELAAVAGPLVTLRAVAQLVPLAVALIVLSPPLAIGGALLLVPFGVGIAALRSRWKRASERSQALVEQLHAGVDDLVKNLDLWRTYGASEIAERAIDDAGARAAHAAARVDGARAALSGANEVLGALALLGAIALATRLGLPLGDGTLVAFATVFFMAYRPLRDLGDARAWSARGAVALEALDRMAGESASDAPPASAQHAPQLAVLELADYGARDRGPRTSLCVAPGELVCVMGPTGSGKTTLLRALLGLAPAAGRVRYAGCDLSNAGVGPASRPFAWVPQDAPLVTASLLENVMLVGGDPAAARAALDRIGATPLFDRVGDARIGPGGRPLSGGERRQVAIARALTTGLPVLLLDEPTEGLDARAQAAVLDTLERLRGSVSAIVVTHRPEVAEIADRVVHIGSDAPVR